MTDRYYIVNQHGMATLCTDQADAVETALDADIAFPRGAPHRAVQMVELACLHAENERLRDLDCPHCGGSGHVDDVQASIAVDAARYRLLRSAEVRGFPGIVVYEPDTGEMHVVTGVDADAAIDAAMEVSNG